MKLRNEWMTDNEYFGDDYPNNLLLESAVARFEIQRDSSLEGKNATVDGTSERIVVQNHTNPLNQVKYDKKTHYNMSSLVHTGSVVEFDNKTWLVVSKIFDNLAYKTASVLECTHTLNLYKSGILYEIPCVVESQVRLYSMSVDETKYISQLEDNIVVRIPNNDITSSIQINDIYKIGRWNYKITNLSDIIESGVLLIKMQIVAEQQQSHNFTISILNPSPLTITTLQTVQLNVSLYNNNELVSPLPPLTFTSSNEEICTVDENGLITPLQEGNVTITVSLTNDTIVSDSIDVTIQDIVDDLYTIDVFGENEVVLGDTTVVQAKVYNNGVEDNVKVIAWEIANNDGSGNTYLSKVSQDNRSITLQASSNTNYKNKYVTVRGKLFDNASVFDELIVQLITLF